ncbi:hypothetical protein HanIR_Chr02g0060121 [Helianthus annuus]|nr:hypothetical protein HanIR_Chr02g0060121 [Helianthus annuus]
MSRPAHCLLETEWSQVVVLVVSAHQYSYSYIYIHNLYIIRTHYRHIAHQDKSQLSFNIMYTPIQYKMVAREKPRVSHYPQVLRTFVPKVKAVTVKLV